MSVIPREMYKAEVLLRLLGRGTPVHLLVNGGCDFRGRFPSSADDIIEEIHFRPSAESKIIVKWTPSYRNHRPTMPATLAKYEEEGKGYIQFDNAHVRGKLHLDIDYAGTKGKHLVVADIWRGDWVDPRRIALVALFHLLEERGQWHIPVQFYLPLCTWWPEFKPLPNWLVQRKPPNVSMTTMCEAMMLQASLSPDTTSFHIDSIGSRDPATIVLSIADQVAKDLGERGALNWTIRGLALLQPFPIMAPPGSNITGSPPEIIERVKQRSAQVRGLGLAPLSDNLAQR